MCSGLDTCVSSSSKTIFNDGESLYRKLMIVNLTSTLIFDFTFISLHVSTLRQDTLHSILNYTTICWLVFVTTELYLGSKDKPNLLLEFLPPF
jgi:hypothetical protein